MTGTNLTHDQEMAVESHTKQYWRVFWILAFFTVLEYCYASFLHLPFITLVVGLMAMALFKASMVGLHFMHLKFEGKWVYGMLIPAGILAAILTFALAPDVAMQPVTEENPDLEGIEGIESAPIQPGAASWVLPVVGPRV
jgi:cytochrome c oxidase subunit 4